MVRQIAGAPVDGEVLKAAAVQHRRANIARLADAGGTRWYLAKDP
jgi:hypothetical protein